MVWQTILCILAACGLALVVWVAFGALLLPLRPRQGATALLWRAAGDAHSLQRTCEALTWLRESGLTPQTLIIWDDGLDEEARQAAEQIARSDPRVHIASAAQTLEALRENINGRGTDDPAGHREHGGLSK